MGWFGSSEGGSGADFYVDLGTANTVIAGAGRGILLNEPSLIAYSELAPGKRKIIAVGDLAKEKIAKTPGNILSYRPLREGAIADDESTETMLVQFMSRPGIKSFFQRPTMVLSLPFGVTEVEKRAAIRAGKAAGAKHVILVDEPMLAALGAGLPVEAAKGSMVVDIGGGTTEVAVIALSDIVYCEAIRMGGHRFDEAIMAHLQDEKGFLVSDMVAEDLKIKLGTATPKKDIRTLEVQGRLASSGVNTTMTITSEDIGNAMDDGIQQIINSIHKALENTPPELVSDIIETGIVLTGGGALIRNLDLRLENEVRLQVRIATEPLLTIAKGGEALLGKPELLARLTLEV